MNSYYPNLLSPIKVGNRILKNRIICSASKPYNLYAGENFPTENIMEVYGRKAEAGAAIVTVDGCNFENCADEIAWDASSVGAKHYMARLADAIHAHGSLANGVVMIFPDEEYDVSENVVQIRFRPGDRFGINTGKKAYSTAQLYALIEKYAQLCKNMADAGFDGTYIHMSYRMMVPGRLLSPTTNTRTDEFGGSFENRIRFSLLLSKRIKELCGKDFIIEATLSGHDMEPEGWTIEDTVKFAEAAKGLIDIFTLRSPELDDQHPTGYAKSRTPWLYMAEEVKKHNPDMIIAASGGFFYPDDCENAIAEGKADMISMARSFISNLDYGKKLYDGCADELRPCLRCNKCHTPNHNLTVCAVNPAYPLPLDIKKIPEGTEKKVAVIGGGPAGMQAALTCAQRGIKVTLYEKEARLGGLINHARYVDFKWPMNDFLMYMERKINESELIDVRLNTLADPEQIEAEGYDAVIAAVGSHSVFPPIKGIETAISAVDAYGKEDQLGQRVVVIGGGDTGVETALHFAHLGKDVVILEMTDRLAGREARMHYYNMFMDAVEAASDHLKSILNVVCVGVEPGKVSYRDKEGKIFDVETDSVVVAAGLKSNTDIAMNYAGCGKKFFSIGDCAKMGDIQSALRSGYQIAATI